jgi:hypothetical protein
LNINPGNYDDTHLLLRQALQPRQSRRYLKNVEHNSTNSNDTHLLDPCPPTQCLKNVEYNSTNSNDTHLLDPRPSTQYLKNVEHNSTNSNDTHLLVPLPSRHLVLFQRLQAALSKFLDMN